MRFLWAILILFVLTGLPHILVAQQPSPTETIAILPFTATGVNDATLASAQNILRMEITRLTDARLIPEKQVLDSLPEEGCSEIPCAIDLGKRLSASKVILCNMSALGEKIIVHYFLVDVPAQKAILKEQLTATFVEDLDRVMKRIATSLVQEKSPEKTAEVGNIVTEETIRPLRRSSRGLFGITFGYLYPENGYDRIDRSFTLEIRIANELPDYEIGMLFSGRKGFAVNIYGSRLFSRKDFAPYLGAGFGFHWVSHRTYYFNGYDYEINPEDKKKDGFEVNLNGGVKLFRTYNFQIIANLAYAFVLNDYDDRAAIFTIGILH